MTDPGRLSRHNDDEWLNAWTVSWIAHQLPRDPLRLFDANMFHPTEDALAYTEPLLVPGLLGAPLRWLGASPMLTYNLLLLAGLTLTALALFRLIVAWTGDPWAGVVAGALLAFSTATLTRLPHLQALHLYPLPLAVLAFDRLLRRSRTRDAAWLGAWVICAALTSGYLAVFVTAALGAALLVRMPSLWNRRGAGAAWRLAVAAAVTLAVLLGLLHPYLERQVARPLTADAPDIATALTSFLATAARMHYGLWSDAFFSTARQALFPGVVALVLAAAALAIRTRRAEGARPLLLAVAAAGVCLSLGPLTPVYEWAYDLFPPVRVLRAPSRFGLLVVFAVAALAGLGLAGLRRRVSPRRGAAVAVGLLALATVENLHAPISYRPVDWTAPIHRALAAVGPGPIAELPFYSRGEFHRNAWYLLASTNHWRPMVAGFGGSRPPGFDDLVRVAATWPSTLAVARLHALGVPHVIVHGERDPRDAWVRAATARLGTRTDVGLVAEAGRDRLYRIGPVAAAHGGDWLARLPWPELRAVGPGGGSWLVATHGARNGVGLQAPGRFVAYVEDTSRNAHLRLRLPVSMRGHFTDALTGNDLGAATVHPVATDEAPWRLPLPARRRAVLLHLVADRAPIPADLPGRAACSRTVSVSRTAAGRRHFAPGCRPAQHYAARIAGARCRCGPGRRGRDAACAARAARGRRDRVRFRERKAIVRSCRRGGMPPSVLPAVADDAGQKLGRRIALDDPVSDRSQAVGIANVRALTASRGAGLRVELRVARPDSSVGASVRPGRPFSRRPRTPESVTAPVPTASRQLSPILRRPPRVRLVLV